MYSTCLCHQNLELLGGCERVRVRVRVSSLVFVERKVGGSKLSVLET